MKRNLIRKRRNRVDDGVDEEEINNAEISLPAILNPFKFEREGVYKKHKLSEKRKKGGANLKKEKQFLLSILLFVVLI